MKYYLVKDLNDSSKYKIEFRKDGLVEWPQSIDQNDLVFCVITKDLETEEYFITLDEGEKAAKESSDAALRQIEHDYMSLQKEVSSQMATAFNTSNEGSAIRQYLMFIRMSTQPEVYNNEGLRALNDVVYLKRGDHLDSTQKIKDYADGMLAVIDQFSIDAEKKVIEFLDKKEAITGQW